MTTARLLAQLDAWITEESAKGDDVGAEHVCDYCSRCDCCDGDPLVGGLCHYCRQEVNK
jgi:hypothetical protein